MKRYLEHNFKSMVVNVLVDVEGCEDVERMAEVDFPRNGCITLEDWEKVSGADY